MNNAQRNTYVRKAIESTLIKLLKNHDPQQISVAMLVDKANVGRASFYRNYKSIKDVIVVHTSAMLKRWQKNYDAQPHVHPNELLISLLDYMKKHQNYFLMLQRCGYTDIILDIFLSTIQIESDTPNALAYLKSSIAYMLYGWIIEWIKRGMQESGSELAKMLEEAQQEERLIPLI